MNIDVLASEEPVDHLRTTAKRVGFLVFCFAVAAMATSVRASEWQIVGLGGAVPVGTPEVRILADGAFSGTTGCNRFQGSARLEGNELIVEGPVATTRMACPDDAMAAQDDKIIAVFSGRMTVSFDPLLDVLRLSNGGTVLDLKSLVEAGTGFPEAPQAHAGLERPAGEPPYLNPFGLADGMPIRVEPDVASSIVGGAFSGQVLRNAGCEGDWCQVTSLDGSVSGWAEQQTLEASDTALRAGQGVFDATGILPCAKEVGAPMAQCAFGVARDAGANATVAIFRPDGKTRALFFSDGALLGADTSEADGGHGVSSAREGDLFLIRVNDERYEIPDAIVQGE
ncbi:META domain-containing protein [Marimonas sp. MJW-29]|uniref:META domain-containing protein n=1 Tax=Sulfitobacter sediminis TaxID=3234186 RepID=A0ABV3RLH5_9RHOB